jgi:hypothetical protein
MENVVPPPFAALQRYRPPKRGSNGMKLFFAIVVLLVIVGVGVWFFFFRKKESKQEPPSIPTTEEQDSTTLEADTPTAPSTEKGLCTSRPGFQAHPNMDRYLGDILKVDSEDAAYEACVKDVNCKAFNSAGWVKGSATPISDKVGVCLYTKI